MRVGVYYSNSDIRVEEQDFPEISEDEILLKVRACGICGSDLMEWYRIERAPVVLGHEISGEVHAIGRDVSDWKVGDRATVTHHVPCNTCRYCLRGHHTVCESLRTTNVDPGGFAEFIRIPSINVDRGMIRLPDDMSYDEGTFVEPLGCVVRAQHISCLQTGDRVLVLGCGVAGILHIQLARSQGCAVTGADIVKKRRELALRFGASQVFHPDDLDPDMRYDQVIVCTTAKKAAELALSTVDRGGTVLFFAPTSPGSTLQLDVASIWRDEVKVMTSYAAAPVDLSFALSLIERKVINVRDMITHVFDLKDIQRAFQIASNPEQGLKVLIRPFSG